ncbi:hypothetical protein VII00023_00270 [Vibrio ichthyoenteri ATCC 700023]|uniref:Lipoprotein n=1 Tax=Vibrio ichthyoenteri ATCC 700023 TaxID=870968 RepID=F9RX11_9VIBR|nr:LPP20 family lipoprotein [Vibrio ichthyoenteri]EGU48584.1 hypothetical protein VII00023_00270 [Vibrio ichthyoenteri ATCC 700023]
MKKTLLLLVMTAVTGCQSTQQPTQVDPLTSMGCTFFGEASVAAPDWICSGSIDDARFAYMALGVSENSGGGVAHQRNLAILDAQQQIAKEVATEVVQVMQTKAGTLGVAGVSGGTAATSEETNAMAQVALKGAETLRAQKGPDGYFYVLMGLPADSVQGNVESMLDAQASGSNQSNESQTLSNQELADQINAALVN